MVSPSRTLTVNKETARHKPKAPIRVSPHTGVYD